MNGEALAGLKVIDVTIARAGPTAVRQLADWGATVIRIEPPNDGGVVIQHNTADFINLHGNKRSITLNLKSAAGREVLFRLLEDADILVENFKAPVKRRLGISYDDLRERFPRLIYGSISGFGQDGPDADRGAVDQVIQGTTGLMSITGDEGGEPARVGIAIADISAGVLLANGLLLAVIERMRSGQGQWVQVSLTEALLSFLDFQAVRWTADGQEPERAGNHHPTMAPMGTFQANDGYLNIAAPGDRLWRRLCEALGASTLIDKPGYETAEDRFRNRAALAEDLQAVLGTRSRAEWVKILDAADVPCGSVNTVPEAFDDPQIKHLAMTTTVNHPERGEMRILRNPITMSRTPRSTKVAAPLAGQHTVEILHELGLADEDIDALREDGTI